MASQSSYDIVSKVDMQEVDNALNQANKEFVQRYDFKGSVSKVERSGETLTLHSDDEFKLKLVVDVLQSKLIKRKIGLKSFGYGKMEPAAKGTVRQNVEIRQGIDRDNAKKINIMIKNTKLKVSSQIQGDQLRVTGKSKDDLQAIMGKIKDMDLEIEVQFQNYR